MAIDRTNYNALVDDDGTNLTGTVWDKTAIADVLLDPTDAAIAANKVNDFRLSLTTATPVTTADVTAAGTLYACQYGGNQIALYDGSAWNIRASAEFSLALTLTSGKPYDVFCYDNAGVPTLEVLVWTNDTTRATALALQDGVLVKSGAATRRYLGSLYATGANTTEDSKTKRYLWNYYHRMPRQLYRDRAVDSYTYTTATWRQMNGDATDQVEIMVGVAEVVLTLNNIAGCSNTDSGVAVRWGIGEDATNAPAAGDGWALGFFTTIAGMAVGAPSMLIKCPAVGRHYYAALEYSGAAGTTTWYGDGGSPANVRSGLYGHLLG